jgi:hypothetical protein
MHTIIFRFLSLSKVTGQGLSQPTRVSLRRLDILHQPLKFLIPADEL